MDKVFNFKVCYSTAIAKSLIHQDIEQLAAFTLLNRSPLKFVCKTIIVKKIKFQIRLLYSEKTPVISFEKPS